MFTLQSCMYLALHRLVSDSSPGSSHSTTYNPSPRGSSKGWIKCLGCAMRRYGYGAFKAFITRQNYEGHLIIQVSCPPQLQCTRSGPLRTRLQPNHSVCSRPLPPPSSGAKWREMGYELNWSWFCNSKVNPSILCNPDSWFLPEGKLKALALHPDHPTEPQMFHHLYPTEESRSTCQGILWDSRRFHFKKLRKSTDSSPVQPLHCTIDNLLRKMPPPSLLSRTNSIVIASFYLPFGGLESSKICGKKHGL